MNLKRASLLRMRALPLTLFLSFYAFADSATSVSTSSSPLSKVEFDVELGRKESVFSGFKFPTSTGSNFDFNEQKPGFALRIFALIDVNERWGARLGWAPIRQSFNTEFNKDMRFDGVTFVANQGISVSLDWDRYVAGVYRIFPGVWDDELIPRLGVMIQGEALDISLDNGSVDAGFSSTVYRPVMFAAADWILSEDFFSRIEFDGWVDSEIRRLEFAWSILYTSYLWNIGLGYRIIETERTVDSHRSAARIDMLNAKVGLWF